MFDLSGHFFFFFFAHVRTHRAPVTALVFHVCPRRVSRGLLSFVGITQGLCKPPPHTPVVELLQLHCVLADT